MLTPLYYPGPHYRRAIAKPRGYAGDYKLILMYGERESAGTSLYEQFLDLASKEHTLSKTVLERQKTALEELRDAISKGAEKIVCLASGAATEIRWLLLETEPPDRDVTFVLIDQDEEALAFSHASLHEALIESAWDTTRTHFDYLHFSIRQFLRPRNSTEEEVGKSALEGADMIYSMGLFDYLPDKVARPLIEMLYSRLRNGGRLFVGNLESEPDSTWLMEYVLGWHLVWRTPRAMTSLGDGLHPAPQDRSVTKDPTGRCLFLRLIRPAD